LITSVLFGQSGTLKYKIDFLTADPEMAEVQSMLAGSTMELYFNENHTSTIMRLGTLSTTITIVNLETKKSLTIVESMMGNFFGFSNLADESLEPPASNLRVQLTEETRVIAGIECKKALLFDSEGNEFAVWYSPILNFPILSRFDIGQHSSIPGAMVEFEMKQEKFIMRFTLASFSDKIENANVFVMAAPVGFVEMSAEFLQSFGF